MMANSPALAFPDFSDLKARPFILAGDFSPTACSASLHQYQYQKRILPSCCPGGSSAPAGARKRKSEMEGGMSLNPSGTLQGRKIKEGGRSLTCSSHTNGLFG